jgi:hypothetical protein
MNLFNDMHPFWRAAASTGTSPSIACIIEVADALPLDAGFVGMPLPDN